MSNVMPAKAPSPDMKIKPYASLSRKGDATEQQQSLNRLQGKKSPRPVLFRLSTINNTYLSCLPAVPQAPEATSTLPAMLDACSPSQTVPTSPAPSSSASSKTLQKTVSRRHLPSGSPDRPPASRSPSPEPPAPTPAQAPRIKVVPPPVRREDEIKPTPKQRRTAADEEDVFSLTDVELAEAYTFTREIGFGNWGSVWEVRRKRGSRGAIAIKLVHRSKTPTTAARVRALWNEMKVVRSLPGRHPCIIDFESFIITPSYALVTMPFCERLMPVGVPEDQARKYFRGLIDGVRFLHEHSVAHNDIKPANVLLSAADVPVLVDFGFATRWDPAEHADPFISTISWGTPEYLSAARARGQKHDERTSDVWSLGITCFEILMGRTPFEESEQEQFSSTQELEVYYERTVVGAWIGKWSMSASTEELLKGMTHPVDSMRLTATQAVQHHALKEPVQPDRRRSNLPRPYSQSTRALPPSSPPRSFPAHSTTNSSGHSLDTAPREKKTASPPKKVAHTAIRALASKPDKEDFAFLRYEKSSERLAAAAKGANATTRKAHVQTATTSKLSSPSRDRLRPVKAVKVKPHGSPRKAVVASSPRRTRVASNASRLTTTAAPKIAYHRPTPPSSSSPAASPDEGLNSSRTSSRSNVSALVESGGSPKPPRRAKADALRSKKRPERILIDASARQVSLKQHAVAAGKENAHHAVEREQDETRLEAASPKAIEVLGVKRISRVPVPSDKTAKAESSHARHTSVVDPSGMRETQEHVLSEKVRKHQTFDSQSLRPSASFQTLTPRVSEASLPSINVAQSSEDAGIDTKLDRISLWVRNVDRLVEETRDSIHARNSDADAGVSTFCAHKPSQSESYLSTPHKGPGLQPPSVAGGTSHVLSPSHKVTPSRTTLNGITVFLPNGRGLADVPESISGSPAASRSLSSPAHKVGAAGGQRLADEDVPAVPTRAFETIHFANPPVHHALRQGDNEQPRSTRLKRSRSKLLAMFQAGHDPGTDPALTAIPTERLSFLKFPPPETHVSQQQPHAPIKHRSSLLRLKSIKNIRAALSKDKEPSSSSRPQAVAPPASQIPVLTGRNVTHHHQRQHSVAAVFQPPSPNPPPPTPSSFNPSEPLTPRSPPPPSPAEVVPVHRVETDQTHFGTLNSRKSLSRANTHKSTTGKSHHKASGSLSEGLRSLFSPTPPPQSFSREDLERERMRAGTPNTMMSVWTDTTVCGETVVGSAAGHYGVSHTSKDEGGGNGRGRLATALKGLSFGRRKKGVVVVNPALEYDY